MIEMRVAAVGRDPTGAANFLLLEEREGARRLVLGIGSFEADAIALAAGEQPHPRPLTHDLLAQVVTRLGGELQRLVIHDIREKAFIAQLEIDSPRGVIELDCRPSDGVAVALRVGIPVFAAEEVLAEAGVVPDEEEEGKPRDTD